MIQVLFGELHQREGRDFPSPGPLQPIPARGQQRRGRGHKDLADQPQARGGGRPRGYGAQWRRGRHNQLPALHVPERRYRARRRDREKNR